MVQITSEEAFIKFWLNFNFIATIRISNCIEVNISHFNKKRRTFSVNNLAIDESLLVQATENTSVRLLENEWLMLQTLRLFRRAPFYPIEKRIKVNSDLKFTLINNLDSLPRKLEHVRFQNILIMKWLLPYFSSDGGFICLCGPVRGKGQTDLEKLGPVLISRRFIEKNSSYCTNHPR